MAAGDLTFLDSDFHGLDAYRGIFHDGNFLYVVGAFGIYSYSVDASGNLTFIDSDSQGGFYWGGVWGDGNFIYTATTFGLYSYSVDGSGNLTFIDDDDQGGTYRDVWGDGTYIYAATTDGLRSYSVDGSGNLTFIDIDDQGDTYVSVWGDGTFIYCIYVGDSDGIRSYSVDGSGNLTFIDDDDQGGFYNYVWGDGNFIYCAYDTQGIISYSVDGSGNFTFIDIDDQGGTYESIWGDGNFIYCACNTDGIRSYSVDGSGNFTFIDVDYQGEVYEGIYADNDFIYVACLLGGARTYEVENASFSSSSSSSSSSRSSSSRSSSCHILETVTFGERDADTYKNVTEDSYGDGTPGSEDFNFGDDEHLLVGFYGSAGRVPFIKFDLDALDNLISTSSQILNATLNIAVGSNEIVDDGKLYLHRLKRDWNGGTKYGSTASNGEVTWRNAKHDQVLWGSPGADADSDRGVAFSGKDITDETIGYLSFNVTTAVKYMFTNDEDNGFTFSHNFDGGLELVSSESPQTYRPYLEIDLDKTCSSSSSSSRSFSLSSSSSSSSSSKSSSSSRSSSSSSSSIDTDINFGENTNSDVTGITDDTYLDDEFPDMDFKDSVVLELQREMSPGLKEVLIKFNLDYLKTKITLSSQISSARLFMKTTGTTQDSIIVAAHQNTRDWGNADWNYYEQTTSPPYLGRWTVGGGLGTDNDTDHVRTELDRNTISQANTWYIWDVVSSVIDQYDNDDWSGFHLRYPVLNGDLTFGAVEFYSSEALNPDYRPYLLVEFTV